jgi:hypothetical protein
MPVDGSAVLREFKSGVALPVDDESLLRLSMLMRLLRRRKSSQEDIKNGRGVF